MKYNPHRSNKDNDKWYKKWWLWLLIGIIIIFVIPIVINFCYTEIDFCPTDWNGGDVLQFYGSILSFTGTILLGVLALWQNYTLNRQNASYQRMLEIKDLPVFQINIICFDGLLSKPKIQITNITNNVATNFEVLKCGIRVSDSEEYFSKFVVAKMTQNYLNGTGEILIDFFDDKKTFTEKCEMNVFEMIFRYTDIYGVEHNKVATRNLDDGNSYCAPMIIKDCEG